LNSCFRDHLVLKQFLNALSSPPLRNYLCRNQIQLHDHHYKCCLHYLLLLNFLFYLLPSYLHIDQCTYPSHRHYTSLPHLIYDLISMISLTFKCYTILFNSKHHYLLINLHCIHFCLPFHYEMTNLPLFHSNLVDLRFFLFHHFNHPLEFFEYYYDPLLTE